MRDFERDFLSNFGGHSVMILGWSRSRL